MKKITFLMLAVLFVSNAWAQFPEGFEGDTFPPNDWISFNGNDEIGFMELWDVNESYAKSGNKSAFIEYENLDEDEDIAEDWLVTPSVAITASNATMSFFQRRDGGMYGDTRKIYVSTTSQTAIASFVAVDSQPESAVNVVFTGYSVDLSDYIGQSIYVAFVFTNNNGDNWYIDDVNFSDTATLPTCASIVAPENEATAVTFDEEADNSITFSWMAPSTGPEVVAYQVYVKEGMGDFECFGITEDLSMEIPGFGFNKTYYWKVVPENDNGAALDCATGSFTTIAETPVIPDYMQDFEGDFAPTGWSLGRGPLESGPTGNTSGYWSGGRDHQWLEVSENLSAVITLMDSGEPVQDWLVSPLFDLSDGPHYLNFDIALTTFGSTAPHVFADTHFVTLMISEDDGATWTELKRWDETTTVGPTPEAVPQITLSQEGNVRFAFFGSEQLNTLNVESWFFIDNFQVTTEELSTSDHANNTFTHYPNPVSDYLHISGAQDINEVAVYNLIGQKVFEQKFNTLDVAIDLSRLAAAQYFVKVATAKTSKTIKISKN